jgi:hypothetical protein
MRAADYLQVDERFLEALAEILRENIRVATVSSIFQFSVETVASEIAEMEMGLLLEDVAEFISMNSREVLMEVKAERFAKIVNPSKDPYDR